MTNLNNKKEENLNYTRTEYPDDLRHYEMPPQPYTRNMRIDTIWDARNIIEELERAYSDFISDFENGKLGYIDRYYTPDKIAIGVLRYLGKEYITSLPKEIFVAGRDSEFEIYMTRENPGLYERLNYYIGRYKRDVKDDCGGLNDIGHLAFSTLVKLTRNYIPDHWGSWGGDLASGMGNLNYYCNKYPQLSTIRLSDSIIGAHPDEPSRYLKENNVGLPRVECNFVDLCDDADSIALARYIDRNRRELHAVSNAMSRYYDGLTMRYRFRQFEDDGFDTRSVSRMREMLIKKVADNHIDFGAFDHFKGNATTYEKVCACDSLAHYIYEMCL